MILKIEIYQKGKKKIYCCIKIKKGQIFVKYILAKNIINIILFYLLLDFDENNSNFFEFFAKYNIDAIFII